MKENEQQFKSRNMLKSEDCASFNFRSESNIAERDTMMHTQLNAWRERIPVHQILYGKPSPPYNASEIYDNPAEHSTIAGIFRYCSVDVIK